MRCCLAKHKWAMFLLQLCKFGGCLILALEKRGAWIKAICIILFIHIRCKLCICFFSVFLKFFNVVFAYISLITHVCMVCKNMGGPIFFREFVMVMGMIHRKIYPKLATSYIWNWIILNIFLYFWLHTWIMYWNMVIFFKFWSSYGYWRSGKDTWFKHF